MHRVIAILGLLILAGCKVPGVPGSGGWSGGGPSAVSMACAVWDFRYGEGMPAHPLCNPDGSFSFNWTGELDYLTTNVSMAASKVAHARFKVEAVSGSPMFVATEGGLPACRIMLEVRGDDMRSENGRWWARMDGPQLQAPGEYVMDVPLNEPQRWSNVLGKVGVPSILGNLGAVGLTCGGEKFGHGVRVTGGQVKVTVMEFSVQ